MAYGRYDDTAILALNNRFGSNVVNSRFDLEPLDNLKFTLTNYYVDTYFGFPTSNGDRFDPKEKGGLGLDPNQNQETVTALTGLTAAYWPLVWWENTLSLGYLYLDSRYNNPANPLAVTWQTEDYFGRDLEKQYTAHYRSNFYYGSKESLGLTTTLGVEMRHAQGKAWSRSWDWGLGAYAETLIKARRGSSTWYFQEQLAARNRFFLTLGASLEDNRSFTKSEFCPRVSAAVRFPETDTTLRAAAGRAVKAPSFTETDSRNPFFLGNPALKPEKNSSWEVGLDQYLFTERLQFGITYFQNYFKDLIQWTQTAPGAGNYVNIARADTQGLEFSLQAKPVKGLTFRTAYTYMTDFKVVDDGGLQNVNIQTGKNLLRRPRQSWNFNINYLYGPLEVNFHGLYVGRRDDREPLNAAPWAVRVVNGGFFTADLAVCGTIVQNWGYLKRVQLLARAQNMFDRYYTEVYGYSSPRFQVIGGLGLEM
jgi:vitamin B12 transporter